MPASSNIKPHKARAGIHIVLFIIVLLINYLANSLPLNNITTGEISNMLPNLFTPAGFTFSIWGVIYLMLTGFIIFQAKALVNPGHPSQQKILSISTAFIISCFANAAWLIAWHFRLMLASVCIMIVLLICLVYIHEKLKLAQDWQPLAEKLWLDIPFSIYLGWICIATIANITTALVDYNINPLGLKETTWTIIMLIIGTLLAIFFILKKRNAFYGLAVIWAFYGIIAKRTEAGKTDFETIIYTAQVCIAVIALSLAIKLLSLTALGKKKSAS